MLSKLFNLWRQHLGTRISSRLFNRVGIKQCSILWIYMQILCLKCNFEFQHSVSLIFAIIRLHFIIEFTLGRSQRSGVVVVCPAPTYNCSVQHRWNDFYNKGSRTLSGRKWREDHPVPTIGKWSGQEQVVGPGFVATSLQCGKMAMESMMEMARRWCKAMTARSINVYYQQQDG